MICTDVWLSTKSNATLDTVIPALATASPTMKPTDTFATELIANAEPTVAPTTTPAVIDALMHVNRITPLIISNGF